MSGAYNPKAPARLFQRELTKLRRKAEHDRLRALVLAYLEQNGPRPFAQILEDLNACPGQLQRVATQLKKEGALHVAAVRPGFDSRKVWSLTPFPKPRPQAKAVKLPAAIGLGLDPEDLAWMAYWQLPRAERLARDYAAQGERRP